MFLNFFLVTFLLLITNTALYDIPYMEEEASCNKSESFSAEKKSGERVKR